MSALRRTQRYKATTYKLQVYATVCLSFIPRPFRLRNELQDGPLPRCDRIKRYNCTALLRNATADVLKTGTNTGQRGRLHRRRRMPRPGLP